ncbi:hypothetical protein I3843_05G227900 [Carya illinoinensis]|nr:hypothetical protein I3843_05G227900 [Carya illinoinensis]
MGGEAHVLKRIPRIRFPQRHPKSIASDVPAAPTNTAVGGKASLQPKRTPVSDKEIEAILLGGCF